MDSTFTFKSERNWDRVYDALYETDFHFASYGYKAITCFGQDAAEFVRQLCKKHRIAISEEKHSPNPYQ